MRVASPSVGNPGIGNVPETPPTVGALASEIPPYRYIGDAFRTYLFLETDGELLRPWMAEIEEREKNATGIRNLKVGFNKVFGYYIEVSKSQTDLVPDTYIRKQTLTTGERYITEELKRMETEVLGAGEKLAALEYEIFTRH